MSRLEMKNMNLNISIGSTVGSVSVLVQEESPQVVLHAEVSSNHAHLARGANLSLQLVVTSFTHGMTTVALHDLGLMSHVLQADRAFWLRNLRLWDSCNSSTSDLSTLINETLH